jgi:predicted nucleotidyltransferase
MDFSAPLGGLFTEPRAAVLAVLLQSGQPMTGRQLHSMVAPRWSLRTVQGALDQLDGLGLVEREHVGRAITHRLNREHYAVLPLQRLLSPVDALRDVVESFVTERVQEGLPRPAVWLFGSVARGEAHPESDIDLVLVTDAPEWESETFDLSVVVEDRLGNPCDVLTVDPARFVDVDPEVDPFAATLRVEAVPLSGPTVLAHAASGAW